MIDLFVPYVPKECKEAVSDVLGSRFIGQGPKVEEFEKQFQKKFSLNNAVSVSSGTAALETAYDLIGLGRGDEVISSPLTCAATNLLLLRKGCKIIWADILEDTLCIDPVDVRLKVTQKTKAVVQVHLGGIMADVGYVHNEMDGMPNPIPVVSDAAQALGIFNGDYTCCSFQAIKHITTGDGGMIICPNSKDAKDAELLRWFGIDRAKKIANNWQAYKERKMTFDIEIAGTKRHLTDLAAVMGIIGLNHYDEMIQYRARLFQHYKNRLQTVDGIRLIDGPKNTHWLCTILVEKRDDFAKKLFEAHIDTNVVQVRNDIYKIFGGKRADLPVMNMVEEKYLSLPIGMHVTEEDVNYICNTIKEGW